MRVSFYYCAGLVITVGQSYATAYPARLEKRNESLSGLIEFSKYGIAFHIMKLHLRQFFRGLYCSLTAANEKKGTPQLCPASK
jgi:hypothetical protein